MTRYLESPQDFEESSDELRLVSVVTVSFTGSENLGRWHNFSLLQFPYL